MLKCDMLQSMYHQETDNAEVMVCCRCSGWLRRPDMIHDAEILMMQRV